MNSKLDLFFRLSEDKKKLWYILYRRSNNYKRTSTYEPVPFGKLLDMTLETLDLNNIKVNDISIQFNKKFKLKEENYKDINMCFIKLELELRTANDSEIKLELGIVSSHNKRKAVTFALGGKVVICSNGMLISDLIEVRKHTKNVWQDIESKLGELLVNTDRKYHALIGFKEEAKDIHLNHYDTCQLIGMCITNKVFNTYEQIQKVRDLYNLPKGSAICGFTNITKGYYDEFNDTNLWCYYNWCTEALKSAPINTQLQQYKQLHETIIEFMKHNSYIKS